MTPERYDHLAADLVQAYDARDQAALARLNAHYERAFTLQDLDAEIWRRDYAFRQRSSRVPKNYLPLDEARLILAQDAGFGSWASLMEALATGAPGVPAWGVQPDGARIAPRRYLRGREWDDLIAAAREHGITGLDAGGLMTDEVLARVASLEQVRELSLAGSRLVSDDGLRHLARMPRLETLDLTGLGRVTDRGLEVLRHLPNLRRFEMTWHRGVTDAGAAHLAACDLIEGVNLLGSTTGDGVVAAMEGKARLRGLSPGRMLTDDGLRLLRGIPVMTRPPVIDPASPDAPPLGGSLVADGPFTDRGLASLAGLDGLVDLDLFWHVTAITPDGFAHLAALPNLMALGADGELSGDRAMAHIGALPRLQRLRAQGTAATDAGFEALARSESLEGLWGRECPHLGNRGFLALSRMPRLRALGVSCRSVDDQTLAALPAFPALRELTPIDVTDAGFRHVGGCRRLERLTCMYCRETTDAATEHITGLPLRYYYAGLTKITDRSLELLGRIETLEQVDLYEVQGVTDAGLPHLATLPRLREVHLDGLPGVTLEGTKVFPEGVRVYYTT
jgi:hypothetical protein